MSEPVAAVLFDLDDTLCRYRRDPGTVLSSAFERAGVEPLFPVEAYYERFGEFADGAADMDELRERCFAALAAERGYDPETGRAVAEAYSAERDPAAVDPLPGARAAVERLGERYRLGLVTNGLREAQRTKLRAVGMDEAFAVEVFAAEPEHAAKPDPAPFHHACEALGVAPGETVHVGDSPASDVAGAAAAGLRSVLVAGSPAPDPAGPEPTYRVPSPRGLLSPPWER
jgi:putative hydrolase of the HAD superfamily